MPAKRPDRTERIAAEVASGAAAFAIRKILQRAWRFITGREAPEGPDDLRVSFAEAVAWALILGGAVATVRAIAVRYTVERSRARAGGTAS